VLTEDIAVPRSKLAEAVTAIGGIAERHQVAVAILAHAGDGNLNPIFVIDQSDDRRASLGGGGCLRTGVVAGRHLDR
jgi:glycolate oxidase